MDYKSEYEKLKKWQARAVACIANQKETIQDLQEKIEDLEYEKKEAFKVNKWEKSNSLAADREKAEALVMLDDARLERQDAIRASEMLRHGIDSAISYINGLSGKLSDLDMREIARRLGRNTYKCSLNNKIIIEEK